MSSYFSPAFLMLFLPLVIALYSIAPQKARWAVLLCASYAFFWAISGGLLVFLLASTLSVYLLGRWIALLQAKRDRALAAKVEKARKVKKRFAVEARRVLALGIVFNVGLLAVLKYASFFGSAAGSPLSLIGIPISLAIPAFGIPIGISFYTLMAVSYLFDVYRGTAKADKNLGRVALFLSFFPQIMEGPLCRYAETASQLWAGKPVSSENLFLGSTRILLGLAKKVIVADRLNAFVKPVFEQYQNYDGDIIALAAILYTCQLYCGFSGTMDVMAGIGKIFDVTMPKNFFRPFFSRTVSEFWKRWHITLGTWLRDYVFYPLSLSKPLKRTTTVARRHLGNRYGPLVAGSIALFCVWLGNGLWHGSGWQYLFFGMYYFMLILAGGLIEPVMQRMAERMGINRESMPYRCFQILRTIAVVCAGELFFRAHGLQAGLTMFHQMATDFSFASFTNGTVFSVGMDRLDFAVVLVAVGALLMMSIVEERGKSVLSMLKGKSRLIRWPVWYALALAVVVFGAYGVEYTPVDPLYAQF